MKQASVKNKGMHKSFIQINESEMKQLQQLEMLEMKKHAESAPVEKLCVICTENYVRFYAKSIFTCGHKEICLACIHQWCSHSITQKNIPKCLKQKCSGEINIEDSIVMSTLTTALRMKLKEIYKELRNNKKCPMPNCFGFINNGTCDLCLSNFCQNCWNVEHRGDCLNPQILLPQGIKVCPNCGTGIQKDGGCLHIACTVCKFNFCFKCLKSWSARHHATCGTGDKSIWEIIFG